MPSVKGNFPAKCSRTFMDTPSIGTQQSQGKASGWEVGVFEMTSVMSCSTSLDEVEAAGTGILDAARELSELQTE